MSRIDWAPLVRLGLGQLRLAPDTFWALTPAELLAMAGVEGGAQPMSRARMAELLAQFPDKTGGEG